MPLSNYRNAHSGRCFVICNGKSLDAIDLHKLDNEITFGVNAIFRLYTPTYYVAEDDLFLRDFQEEIESFSGCVKIIPHYAGWVNGGGVIKANIHGLPMGVDPFSRDANKILVLGGTVTYVVLQLAYFMGFKQVFIVGLDHDYVIPSDAIKVEGDGVYVSGATDPNHFGGGYFKDGKRFHDPRPRRMEESYRTALCYYRWDKREIWNMNENSRLDIFPKLNYGMIDDIIRTPRDEYYSCLSE